MQFSETRSVSEMTATALQVLEPTLAELAETANREHALTERAVRQAFSHALAAGDALAQARKLVARDGWLTWLDENFAGGWTTAYRYIRVAEHRELLEAQGVGTLTEADKALVGTPDIRVREGTFQRRSLEASALRDDGLTQSQIATVMGTSEGTVWSLLNPKHYEAKNRRRREARKQRRAVAQALRDKKARSSAVKAGGAMAELYAMAERMQDILAQTHRETEDRDARKALSHAGEHYRKMRDEIVKALGVS